MLRILHLFRGTPDDARIAAVEGDVAKLRTDVNGLKDQVTIELVKVAGDLRETMKSAVKEGLDSYREEQWETRLSDHIRELKITVSYWGKRLVVLAVTGLGAALWKEAGPKVAAVVWHWMGWQP